MPYKNHSLLHFFWIYFGSVALLIISAGFLYFHEQKAVLISHEHDTILQYAKMQQYTGNSYIDPLFSFELKSHYKPWYEKNVMRREGEFFIYEAPTQKPNEFLLIRKSTRLHDKTQQLLLLKISVIVMALLGLFSLISWMLARESIRPLKAMIGNLDDFLKNLIHDLNTPATSILLNAKLLRTKSGDNDARRIQRIESSTNEILSLYSNLSIVLNEHKIEFKEQDIVNIINVVTEQFKELYPAIEFHLKLPQESVQKIDRQTLEQILNNLLANACKYSHTQHPSVDIRLQKNRLEIEDNGVGMEHPERVFERLYSEHTQGHGIGMHIVHRLAQLMDLDIKFYSKKNVGTRVTLEFNL